MTQNCKVKLVKKSYSGTNQEKIVASLLLENNINFNTLTQLADQLKISNSSVTRFIKVLNYPSFKHFMFEYKNQQILKKGEHEEITKMAQKMKGNLYIFASRNSRSLAKFMSDRLSYIGIRNYLYSNFDDLSLFFNRITFNDSIILISITGESFLISKVLEKIARLTSEFMNNFPNVCIFSINKWMEIFKKYSYIYISEFRASNHHIDTFEGYNYASCEMIKSITHLLNELKESNFKEKQYRRGYEFYKNNA